MVVSNFTWDWIYEGYESELSAAPDLLPTLRAAYSQASEGWRLPLHGGFATVPRCRTFRLSPGTRRGDRSIRRRAARPLAAAGPAARARIVRWLRRLRPRARAIRLHGRCRARDDGAGRGYPLITGAAHLIAEEEIYAKGLSYVDLVAAVDVVVTKPGYGIIADCVANGTAMLYTSRGRFVEYDVMVREMPRFLRCEYVDLESFLAGRWRGPLRRLLNQPPPPEVPRTDGAEVVAGMILERIGMRASG